MINLLTRHIIAHAMSQSGPPHRPLRCNALMRCVNFITLPIHSFIYSTSQSASHPSAILASIRLMHEPEIPPLLGRNGNWRERKTKFTCYAHFRFSVIQLIKIRRGGRGNKRWGREIQLQKTHIFLKKNLFSDEMKQTFLRKNYSKTLITSQGEGNASQSANDENHSSFLWRLPVCYPASQAVKQCCIVIWNFRASILSISHFTGMVVGNRVTVPKTGLDKVDHFFIRRAFKFATILCFVYRMVGIEYELYRSTIYCSARITVLPDILYFGNHICSFF